MGRRPLTQTLPLLKRVAQIGSPCWAVLAVALAGGGAAYFLKFKKKKPDTRGNADLEDYDYGDEDEYEDGGAEDEGDE